MTPFNFPEIPKSIFTDEQYRAMLNWYNARQNVYDNIARLERTKIFSAEEIDRMRAEMDKASQAIGAILKEYASLHPG